MTHKNKFGTSGNMMKTVVQKAFVNTLHILVHRAHFCRTDEFSGESKPCVLIPLTIIRDKLERVVGLILVPVVRREIPSY
jgi:hypothetical protein